MRNNTGLFLNNSMDLRVVFRALQYRNYRLFFAGQGVSLIGTWMQYIAVGWLVYRLTNSAFLLGVAAFANQIPTFILTPIAGVMADRWNKRSILIITQTLSMMQAIVLAILVLKGAVDVWHVIAMSFFLGIINAFDIPARQSFVVEMVEKREDLGNAIALNSSLINGTRLIGPSIAGVLIATVGEGICFLINGITFLPAIAALASMRIAPKKTEQQQNNHILHRLKEGYSYAFGFAPIRSVILLLVLVSLMGMPYHTLMPVFAKEILHGGPKTLGLLMAATGVGALSGALYLASRREHNGLWKIIAIAASIFGIGLIAFSRSQSLTLSMSLMIVTGFGMMVYLASSNTALQAIVDDDKRGRVMSIYTTAFMGITPFGSLLAGVLASVAGAPNTLLIGGAFCILGSLIFAKRLSLLEKTALPVYATPEAATVHVKTLPPEN